MKILSLLGRLFARRKNADVGCMSENSITKAKHPGMVRTCMSMKQSIIHPADMMEELAISIALSGKKAVSCNLKEIHLFDMSFLNGEFIGSFYALENGGLYYGNIVGQNDIIVCEKNAFSFVETERVIVPLRKTKSLVYALVCSYTKENGLLKPQKFGSFRHDTFETELKNFTENISAKEALEYCKKEANSI